MSDLTKRSFPPDVMLPNKQSAPEWFHQTDANVQKQMAKLWSRKSKGGFQINAHLLISSWTMSHGL